MAHQVCAVEAGAAQQLGQGDRALDRGLGGCDHRRGGGITGLEANAVQTLLFCLNCPLFAAVDLPATIVDQAQFATQGRQAAIGVVAAQHQAVFTAAGEHPIGLAQILGNQVVDQGADITALAREVHRRFAAHIARRV